MWQVTPGQVRLTSQNSSLVLNCFYLMCIFCYFWAFLMLQLELIGVHIYPRARKTTNQYYLGSCNVEIVGSSSQTCIRSLIPLKSSQQSHDNSHSCLCSSDVRFAVICDQTSSAQLLGTHSYIPEKDHKANSFTWASAEPLQKALQEGVVKISARKTIKYSLPIKTSTPWHTDADKGASTEEDSETDFWTKWTDTTHLEELGIGVGDERGLHTTFIFGS